MLELTIRLIVSLAIVVGLLLVLARLGARRFNGSSKAMVHVMHRQQLSKASSLAVVSVGGRVLVLGTTEHQITVLAELDPDELDDTAFGVQGADALAEDLPEDLPDDLPGDPPEDPPEDLPGFAAQEPERETPPGSRRRILAVVPSERRTVGKHALDVPSTSGPLAGSILSPQTWRNALTAATRGA